MNSNKIDRYCGECGYASAQHPIRTSDEWCNRVFDKNSVMFVDEGLVNAYFNEPEKFPNGLQFEADRNGVPFVSYQGNGMSEAANSWFDQEEEDYYQSFWGDNSPLNNWRDKNVRVSDLNGLDVWEHTVTLEQYRNHEVRAESSKKGMRAYRDAAERTDEKRNVFIEGLDGFKTELIIDEVLTIKHHNRLLNVFVDKTGVTRVGSIQLKNNTDGSVTAHCVKCEISHTLNINTLLESENVPELYKEFRKRQMMEFFTFQCIRHGSNHAAAFITKYISIGEMQENSDDIMYRKYMSTLV